MMPKAWHALAMHLAFSASLAVYAYARTDAKRKRALPRAARVFPFGNAARAESSPSESEERSSNRSA